MPEVNHMPDDTTWIRSSFLSLANVMSTDKATDWWRSRKGNGWYKYTDTSLGGNWSINAPYQFCRYADIKEPRVVNVGFGMGRWYSEHIDDYAHNIHFRVGIPAYNGILSYLLCAIDGYSARYVGTGRVPGIFDTLGSISGFIISAMFWEVSLLGMVLKAFIAATASRFYYLKPTMFQYWTSVQTMLNSISANLGLTAQAKRNEEAAGPDNSRGAAEIDREYSGLGMDNAHERIPAFYRTGITGGVKNSDIGIDIHVVASRAQALQFQHQQALQAYLNKYEGGTDISTFMKRMEAFHKDGSGGVMSLSSQGPLTPKYTNKTLKMYQESYTKMDAYRQKVTEQASGKDLAEVVRTTDEFKENKSGLSAWFEKTVDSWNNLFTNSGQTLKDSYFAELRDGSMWFSFRCDNSAEPVTESFSNSSEDSQVAQTLNSISSSISNAVFNLGGVKTGNQFVDGAVSMVTEAAGEFMTGALGNQVFLSPILGLMHGAQIEVPKRWSSSSASLPTGNFTFKLRAGYGNLLSIYQDLYVPLVMLLVLALPRGTGPQSYAQPFYVEYYSKGRSQSKIGIVSNLSVTRGVGNMGWTKSGFPLGIDVTLSIEDMTKSIFTPPMSGMSIFNQLINPLEENAMGDYMAVLSGLGMLEQTYFKTKLKRGWYQIVNQFDSWMSPYRWISWKNTDSIPSIFADYTERR